MTNLQIELFLDSNFPQKENLMINISFKTRNAIRGFFPDTADAEDLKSKNFWRVITENNLEDWNQTRDLRLTRIFNGHEILRLKL